MNCLASSWPEVANCRTVPQESDNNAQNEQKANNLISFLNSQYLLVVIIRPCMSAINNFTARQDFGRSIRHILRVEINIRILFLIEVCSFITRQFLFSQNFGQFFFKRQLGQVYRLIVDISSFRSLSRLHS